MMTYLIGGIFGGMIGCIIGVIVMCMAFVSKGNDEIIADLYEALVDWTELADNIHISEGELYERSIKVLNRAMGRC